MSHENEPEWDEGSAVVVAPAKPELAVPRQYEVLMLNDDYTPMDFVIEVLSSLFNMPPEKANQTMMQVHRQGQAQCGVFSFEVAESKVEQSNSFAQQRGHPLQCMLEQM